ncbi:alanine racemase [Sphingobium sp. H39-3-25]|uniref:alanine racemase n=1 Tax=Sphingobium arseniciresistens TaxID=3030834 RepID=UPI0023B9F980|nr:alanine racemase [Sphingobium arseniciresistens]
MRYVDPDSASALLTIDLDAIVHNYRHIRALAGAARTAAVVKADAYGLGARNVVPALAAAGCRDFFVAHLCEVEDLVDLLPGDGRIYILNGLIGGAEQRCAAIGAIPVLNGLEQIDRWRAEAMRRHVSLPAVVQVDSGMGRLGLSADEVAILANEPELLAGIDLVLLMSHLACADDGPGEASDAQRRTFDELTACLPPAPRALANSGGAFLPEDFRYDLVRPGIALYGGAPVSHGPNPMRAVVRLETKIVQLRDVPAGVGIGYGLTAMADAPRRIAAIPVGYADGWPRALSNRGSVYLDGQRAPIVGRVSMDSTLIDVTAIPRTIACPGAIVELLGPHQGVDDVARDAGTISYEILTQLGGRYARHYLPVAQACNGRRNAA